MREITGAWSGGVRWSGGIKRGRFYYSCFHSFVLFMEYWIYIDSAILSVSAVILAFWHSASWYSERLCCILLTFPCPYAFIQLFAESEKLVVDIRLFFPGYDHLSHTFHELSNDMIFVIFKQQTDVGSGLFMVTTP